MRLRAVRPSFAFQGKAARGGADPPHAAAMRLAAGAPKRPRFTEAIGRRARLQSRTTPRDFRLNRMVV